MDKLIEKLGLYEIINYLFTGIISYMTSCYLLLFFELFNKQQFITFISYLKDWYFLVLIYFIGIMIHECSEYIASHIFYKKGLPSERYFENGNHNLYFELITKKLSETQKTSFDLTDKKQVKEAFGIIYSLVQERPSNEIIQKMNRHFGCFRAFSFIFIIEVFISIALCIHFYILNGFKLFQLIIFIPLGIFTWLSIRRMIRFGKRFADYCYRSYAKESE